MATNIRAEGAVINYTATAAVTSNDVLPIGSFIGVAVTDIANGSVGAVAIEGVFGLAKTTGAITQGQGLWWDATNERVSETPTAQWAGIATEAAGSSATTVYVKINAKTLSGEAATLTLTDDNSAASNGVALRVIETYAGLLELRCENANNADAFWGSSAGSILIHDQPAGTGVALYYDEDGAQGARFRADLAADKDAYFIDSCGNAWKVVYDATPSGEGVALYFDDDASTATARVLYVSPTDASTTYSADHRLIG